MLDLFTLLLDLAFENGCRKKFEDGCLKTEEGKLTSSTEVKMRGAGIGCLPP
jgi:hypothetical protein